MFGIFDVSPRQLTLVCICKYKPIFAKKILNIALRAHCRFVRTNESGILE